MDIINAGTPGTLSVNAVQIQGIRLNVDITSGDGTVSADYLVGSKDGDVFSAIRGAGISNVTVAGTATVADMVANLAAAILAQEGMA